MTVIQKENKEDVEVKPYDVIEAWPEPVDSSLFDEIVADIRKHLHITEDNAIKAAFWSAHTHMFSQFEHTPRLVITAPTSACGKTVLKQVIHAMCDKAKDTDSMTGAALIRYAARGDGSSGTARAPSRRDSCPHLHNLAGVEWTGRYPGPALPGRS